MAKKSEKELILGTVKKKTTKWAKDSYEMEDKQSEKAKLLSKILTEMTFSKEDKNRLAKFASEVSGEKITVQEDNDLSFSPLIALVVTKAPTDKDKHTYETGKVIVTLPDGSAIAENGTAGSPVPPKRQFVRPATAEEMENIPESQIKGLVKEVEFVFE